MASPTRGQRSHLVVAVLTIALSGSFFLHSNAQQPTSTGAKQQAKLNELLKERLAVARDLEKETAALVKGRTGTMEDLVVATRLANEAALEACDTDRERVAVLETFLAAAKDNEQLAAQFFKTGQSRHTVALHASAERLRVEIALERARANQAIKPKNGKTDKKLDERAALAEKQLAVKQAAVRLAALQKKQALAKLTTAKALVDEARAAESFREKQVKRYEELARTQSVDARTVDEGRAQYDAAKARRQAAEGNITEWEIQVELEQARLDLAQAEVEEAQLRLKQLKEPTK